MSAGTSPPPTCYGDLGVGDVPADIPGDVDVRDDKKVGGHHVNIRKHCCSDTLFYISADAPVYVE